MLFSVSAASVHEKTFVDGPLGHLIRMKNMFLFSNELQRFRLLLFGLVVAFLLPGCMGGKGTVDPYRDSSPVTGPARQTAQSAYPTGTASDQASYARDVLLPALSRINDRISAYEQKLQSWQGISSRMYSLNLTPEQQEQLSICRQQSTDLLTDYKQIHDQLLRDQPMDVSRRLLNRSLPKTHQKDISYIEGDCPRLLTNCGSSPVAGSTAVGMQPLESSMAAALAGGDYEQVISSFQSLSLPPGEQPGYGVSYNYGVALMKSGREQKAHRVFVELLNRLRQQDQAQMERKLLQLLGDLEFGLGDFRSARSRYEELEGLYAASGEHNVWARQQLNALDAAVSQSGQIRVYAALLLGSLTYNPQRDGFTIVQQAQAFQQSFPVPVAGSSVGELARKADKEAEQWFAGVLEQVDRLSAQQNNQEALLLIQRIPAGILPLDKQAILKIKKASLTAAAPGSIESSDTIHEEILDVTDPFAPAGSSGGGQVVGPDTASGEYVLVTALQETWNQGMTDMQAKEYDRAIKIFSGLLNTSYGTKAGIQIEEASRLAAQDDRKKAAELFVRANRTTDPGARKQLLLSSRALLADILRKYPQSGLGDKVRRNLNRIDQELGTIEQQILFPSPVDG
jgi:tetratricopeptide (TPR) repeat protein